MTKTQKERLREAYDIHSSAHNYIGYQVCDGEEDLLAFRKWVLRREQRAVRESKKALHEHARNYTETKCLLCGEKNPYGDRQASWGRCTER